MGKLNEIDKVNNHKYVVSIGHCTYYSNKAMDMLIPAMLHFKTTPTFETLIQSYNFARIHLLMAIVNRRMFTHNQWPLTRPTKMAPAYGLGKDGQYLDISQN